MRPEQAEIGDGKCSGSPQGIVLCSIACLLLRFVTRHKLVIAIAFCLQVRAKDLKRLCGDKECGWLNKTGLTSTRFQKRWCAIHDLKLYYFDNPRSEEPNGVVSILQILKKMMVDVSIALSLATLRHIVTELCVSRQFSFRTKHMQSRVNVAILISAKFRSRIQVELRGAIVTRSKRVKMAIEIETGALVATKVSLILWCDQLYLYWHFQFTLFLLTGVSWHET